MKRPDLRLAYFCLGATFLFLLWVIINLFWRNDDEVALQELLFWLTLLVPFEILLFQYKAIRNWRIYYCWLVIGLAMLFLYFRFRNDESLININGYSRANGLKATILVLIYFGICRAMSKYIFGTELILPSNKLFTSGSPYDQDEGRNENFMDFVAFFGIILIIVLSFIY